ncbi:interleukin-20 receptor subunit beta isoform X2 [Prionailurus iriomotensis]
MLWSGHPACPSEPLCTINQHEASLDVEPSDGAWRNNILFRRVPGEYESLYMSHIWIPSSWCSPTKGPECDITDDITATVPYNLRVRATQGSETSAWSTLKPPFNRNSRVQRMDPTVQYGTEFMQVFGKHYEIASAHLDESRENHLLPSPPQVPETMASKISDMADDAILTPPGMDVTKDGFHLVIKLEDLGSQFEFLVAYWRREPGAKGTCQSSEEQGHSGAPGNHGTRGCILCEGPDIREGHRETQPFQPGRMCQGARDAHTWHFLMHVLSMLSTMTLGFGASPSCVTGVTTSSLLCCSLSAPPPHPAGVLALCLPPGSCAEGETLPLVLALFGFVGFMLILVVVPLSIWKMGRLLRHSCCPVVVLPDTLEDWSDQCSSTVSGVKEKVLDQSKMITSTFSSPAEVPPYCRMRDIGSFQDPKNVGMHKGGPKVVTLQWAIPSLA